MTTERDEPGDRFERLAARFLDEPDVSAGTGFGPSPGLRVRDRIFAMLVRDELVVKLPRARAEELVGAGGGRPFDAGKGRPMKEWVVVPVDRADAWEALAAEAFEYVERSSRSKR